MQTRNEFRSFAQLLGASTSLGHPSIPQDDKEAPQDDKQSSAPAIEFAEQVKPDEFELMRDVRLFRARIADAVDSAAETVLTDIAADVLARELQLAPVDTGGIVNRALERFFDEQPLRVRVHPDDAARVECGVPVVADESLLQGDAILELQSGSIDASLGVRLAAVLDGMPE